MRQSSDETAGSIRASKALVPRAPHRLVRGIHVDARVAVEDGADPLTLANGCKDLLHHLVVDPRSRHASCSAPRDRVRGFSNDSHSRDAESAATQSTSSAPSICSRASTVR